MSQREVFSTFAEFWPFYLAEHSSSTNRRLHFIGTLLALVILISAVINSNLLMILTAPLAGYFFAWVGHFVVEKNRPATFSYPLWSLMGDLKMFSLMLTGRFPAEQNRLEPEIGKYRQSVKSEGTS